MKSPLSRFLKSATPRDPVTRSLLREYKAHTVRGFSGVRPRRYSLSDPAVAAAIAQTCAEYGFTLDQIRDVRTGEHNHESRYVLAARLYLDARLSLPQIAEVVGYREHSGALHAAQAGASILGRKWPRRAKYRHKDGPRLHRPRRPIIRYVGYDSTERAIGR